MRCARRLASRRADPSQAQDDSHAEVTRKPSGARGEAGGGADLGAEGVERGLLGLVGDGLPLLDEGALGGAGGLEQAQAGGEGRVLQLEGGLQAGLTAPGPDVEELAANFGRVVEQAARGALGRGYVSDWSGRPPPYRPKKRSIMPR